jgi:UDP-N-acetylglucosamine 4,6-dehydratase/UDP-glucose 4-epimerase
MFKGKKILITGGTGSLGQALTKFLLKTDVDAIRIFSRNEHQQVMMEENLKDDRLRFFIGDVRDLPRLTLAMEDIDIVFHAAALKHVPVVEYNPFEGIKTNVIGSQNVIDASLSANVEIAVGIGTDKSVAPLNTYGATKLLMEKIFVTANNFVNPEKHRTKFIALRYGNVLGSSGSVVPKFIRQIKNKEKITITDPNMTRFSITMNEALDFIVKSTLMGKGSEIFVPKLKAYTINDLKDAILEILGNSGVEKIPIRAGEKMHETLIDADEMRHTYETDSTYVVLNPQLDADTIRRRYPSFKRTNKTESYSSDLAEKISKEHLKQIIIDSGLINI